MEYRVEANGETYQVGNGVLLACDAATAKQPTPHGTGAPILGMVLADMTNRALEGKLKYGEPLKAHNTRDALQDLYEELMDATMYIKQAMVERDGAKHD